MTHIVLFILVSIRTFCIAIICAGSTDKASVVGVIVIALSLLMIEIHLCWGLDIRSIGVIRVPCVIGAKMGIVTIREVR